jgi:hypothetical protein
MLGGSLVSMPWHVLRLWMEDALQVWRLTVNILKKPTRGGPPAWGLGVGLTAPHHKKQAC